MKKNEENVKYIEKENWNAAIGLQDVDNLSVSSYLRDLSEKNISKEIDVKAIAELLDAQRKSYENKNNDTDIIALRIAEILSSSSFSLDGGYLQSIHKKLFDGILDDAGLFRTYNIRKDEPILNGKSVEYSNYNMIREFIEYDFSNSKKHLDTSSNNAIINSISSFTSNLWMIHPFSEGNTRTTAVFTVKYLRSNGIIVNNEPFSKHSRYFRNALVRSCFSDYTHRYLSDTRYIKRFFENVIFSKNNPLKNIDLVYFDLFPKLKAMNEITKGNTYKTIKKFIKLFSTPDPEGYIFALCRDKSTNVLSIQDEKHAMKDTQFDIIAKSTDNMNYLKDKIPYLVEQRYAQLQINIDKDTNSRKGRSR